MLLVEPERGDEHAGDHADVEASARCAPMLALTLSTTPKRAASTSATAAMTSNAPTARSLSAPRNTMP